MHSNCMLNYSKSSSYFVVLICVVEVKSMSLIPNICRFQNSKLPSVHADVFFQRQSVSNLLIAVYRKCNFITLRMPKISEDIFKITFGLFWCHVLCWQELVKMFVVDRFSHLPLGAPFPTWRIPRICSSINHLSIILGNSSTEEKNSSWFWFMAHGLHTYNVLNCWELEWLTAHPQGIPALLTGRVHALFSGKAHVLIVMCKPCHLIHKFCA